VFLNAQISEFIIPSPSGGCCKKLLHLLPEGEGGDEGVI
jgi:hypothetical protein